MKLLISYVLPIYNESGNIDLLHSTLNELLKKHPQYHYELIFINDGSQDDSYVKLLQLQSADKRIVLINFARRFGHQMAVTAGLDYAKGDAVIIMDSDMQDPPKVSFDLISKWEEGYQVVYAQRRTRIDSAFKKMTAAGFYWLLGKVAEINIPPNTGDFRLIDRKVADVIREFREHNRFLRGMVSYVGFKQVAVEFDRDNRHAGETGYPLRKMLKFASDGIFGFSWAPLKLISRVGYFISACSFIGVIYSLMVKLLYPKQAVPGWTFVIISVLLIGGIQLITLGIIGNYIGRIYTESQGRPLYIVESVRSAEQSIEA